MQLRQALESAGNWRCSVKLHSFTKTWIEFEAGRISPAQLSSEDTEAQFGCTREHLFPTMRFRCAIGEDSLPHEVTWVRGVRSYHGPGHIKAAIVPAAIRNKFAQFLDLIKSLDSRGAVKWRSVSSLERRRLEDDAIESFKREDWAAAIPQLGQRVMWANKTAFIHDTAWCKDGTCRVLLSWYHPEDGTQKTWVDSRETSNPYPSLRNVLS